ncbi:MAG: YbaK/EbsC family protein [Nocardioidaceae bacterium]
MTPVLGKLSLRPAREDTGLLAGPVVHALGDSLGDRAYVTEIDPDDADTAAFGRRYDVPPEVSANCVIVLGKRSGELRPAGCVVLASTRVDVNNVVRRHLGARRASFAPQEYATEHTGMEYGGITPVGLPEDWPLLVDSRVAAAEWVVVGSGLRRSKLVLPGHALAELPGAVVLESLGV